MLNRSDMNLSKKKNNLNFFIYKRKDKNSIVNNFSVNIHKNMWI